MIPIRPATRSDLQAMADVINPIILAGGTTAFQTQLGPDDIAALTIDRVGEVSTFVALDLDETVAGFQYLTVLDEPGVGHIASFTRQAPPLKGAGRALMSATLTAARAAGLQAIIAEIRADNVPGLGYYSKMGFEDLTVKKAVPLRDGTIVDRIVKRLTL